VVEHRIGLGHCIQLHDSRILARKYRCMDCILREAGEVELQSDMNREDDFSLSKAWKLLIHTC